MWATAESLYSRDGASSQPYAWPAAVTDPDILCRVLDEVDYGLILVDAGLRIRHANHLARHELALGDPLRAVDGELQACTAAGTRQLRIAIKSGFRGVRRLLVPDERPQGQPIAVIPMHHRVEPDAEMVLIALPRRPGRDNLALTFFAHTLHITPAEESVLRALCSGMEVDEIAQAHHVAVCTVRAHIRSLRSKTNCSSIRQLMHRVSMLPPIVPALRTAAALG